MQLDVRRLALMGAALTIAGCGASTPSAPALTPLQSTPATSPSAPSQAPTFALASPTASGATLSISQLGLTMTIPAGLSRVDYQIQRSAIASLQDQSGVAHTPLAQVVLTTPDCPGDGVITVTVWDTDPATLSGQGYGGTVPGSDTHAGSRYLHIEGGDGFPPPTCSAKTTALLQKLVASTTSST